MCFNVCLWGKSDWCMFCQSLGSQCVTKGQRTYTGSLKYCVWKLVSLCQENEWTNDTSTFDIPLSSILVSLFGKKGDLTFSVKSWSTQRFTWGVMRHMIGAAINSNGCQFVKFHPLCQTGKDTRLEMAWLQPHTNVSSYLYCSL